MKTIIDAVNELRGDLGNCDSSRYTSSIWHFDGEYELASEDGLQSLNLRLKTSIWKRVGATKLFNVMVAEMSEGFEEYKREYEMDKTVTVTVGGMVYELNELYLMHNGSKSSQQLHELCEISDGGNFIDENGSHWGFAVNTIKLGSITPAPVELVDGKAYMFSYKGYDGLVALYDKQSLALYTQCMSWGVRDCTNIIPLVPEVQNDRPKK